MCCFDQSQTYLQFLFTRYPTQLVEILVDGRNFCHPFSILLNHVISKTNFTKCIDICSMYLICILLSGTWQLRCENNWYRLLVKYFVYLPILNYRVTFISCQPQYRTVGTGGIGFPPIQANPIINRGRLRLPHYPPVDLHLIFKNLVLFLIIKFDFQPANINFEIDFGRQHRQ